MIHRFHETSPESPRGRALWMGACALLLACACGGSDDRPDAVGDEQSSGSEEEVAAAPRGPARSFLPEGANMVTRLDMRRVRASAVAPDISSALQANPSFQSYSGGTRIDPIQDIDLMVFGADRPYGERRVIVLRHRRTEAEVRARVLDRAVAAGETVAWRDEDGFSITGTAGPRGEAWALVITAEHEVVLCPETELARVLEVAADQRARRSAPDDLIEPALLDFRPAEVATVIANGLPPYEGYPAPPPELRVTVDEVADGTISIHVHGVFEDAARAHAARMWLEQTARYYASQMMVRAVGMHRPLEEAVFAEEGAVLDVTTTLTTEEIRRALGAMALMQLGSGQ